MCMPKCLNWASYAMSECSAVAVQRLAMSEASPLYKKLTEEEKAGYVKRAEGRHAHLLLTGSGWPGLWSFHSPVPSRDLLLQLSAC